MASMIGESKRKVVIVPGNSTVPIRKCCFYSWAEKELMERGIPISMAPDPGMPDQLEAKKSVWLPYIEHGLKCDEHSILVGHSSGAIAGLRFAENNKVFALVLLAAYDHHLDCELEKKSGYFDGPFDWEKIKGNCKYIVQFAGTEDCLVPIEIQRRVAKHLAPVVEYIEIKERNHFFAPPFPPLIEKCEQLMHST
mmetsp:Transcript_11994/g.19522  ORF Transcript_11994/g.19522 Transcript_11994/m.19522 type:complete len:195 (+) Transcript_11994:266-850(+)|eukprot:CAMPEP_0203758266 /NCGR_PEP_ID=MMETSP0098-20131031/11031_1 /ASSEMBLY_ACC=CAM_ASM_000208 /TAXON_ID=96639 /ORGANISM=" , Strain NY0313808BC1" /LENGTH=194 /DNA_ID=CAMNT_0050650591 /DNA_START=56 /DNA_END=640 /DNA_ORIENTATION=-